MAESQAGWNAPAGVSASPEAATGVGQWVKDAATGAMKWVGENKLKSAGLGLMASNVISSMNQSNMMQGANEAQQQSYKEYLNALNPTEDVKSSRYNALASNVRSQSTAAQKKIDDALAARGVRGKGKAAPAGDVSEAEREALNQAYNQIYGTYNVPGSPGPTNYSPSGTNLAVGNTTQLASQALPLMLLMSKYGA
jgi:hypothetical protein